ncbi:MAG: NAD(P)/FAD-dependent oxidoreductase [Gammaproteobacteria bacterium]|nr:NAD(P)/FAD-dependent oxidoreductase [Gammaproteobacteria bacterium]
MTDRLDNPCQVVVIGAGPAGLAAATTLKQNGISRVIVLEREPQGGGIPRHCGHPPFGMREFGRIYSGPTYAKKLVDRARNAGVEIHTSTTVVEAGPGGRLLITSDRGPEEVTADRVIMATGVRESPRSARLISGSRPQGIVNTGALQSMIYLKNRKPFEHPVIIGSELVSFSAILTCRKAGIKPVAMLEEADRVTARWPSILLPRLAGIPLQLNTRLVRIEGNSQVTAIVVSDVTGRERRIDCDGVILSGGFVPEASLARSGHLPVDALSNGPVVDQFGRCGDPAYFATGNLLRPVETAGWCWHEGRQVGHWVAQDLAGELPDRNNELQIQIIDSLIKYSIPQKIALPDVSAGMSDLQLRFSRSAKGKLTVCNDRGIVWLKTLSVRPERRVLIPLKELTGACGHGRLELNFNEIT